MKKKIRIVLLILLALLASTYYQSIVNKVDNRTFYSYKDLITGQEWRVTNVNNKRIEHPINVFNRLSDEEYDQYDEMSSEVDRLDKIINDNQDAHDKYRDDRYTGGLTFDDLGINGGNTIDSWGVTKILHEEVMKRLQKQQDLYLDAANKVSDLKSQVDSLDYQLTAEAREQRNTVNKVRIFLICALLLAIFSNKLFRLSKKTFSFIIND
jgi:peptidoglycan hydrolase CwlO-like protein